MRVLSKPTSLLWFGQDPLQGKGLETGSHGERKAKKRHESQSPSRPTLVQQTQMR